MRFLLQWLLIVGISFVYDVATTLYVLSVQSRHLLPALAMTFTIPFLCAMSAIWWIDSPKWRLRIWYISATAIGATLGTWVSLKWY
jgi:hypothetical protein